MLNDIIYNRYSELNRKDLDIRKSEDSDTTEADSFSDEDEDPE